MRPLEVATLLGASILEKHFTHDKTLPGNDHYHAMDMHDLRFFRANVERDSTMLELTGLSPSLPQGLALLADVARRPSYNLTSLARTVRARAVDDADASASDLADDALDALVFQRAAPTATHPRPLSRSDLIRQHARLWRPDQATLVITGAVDPKVALALVQAAFGDWRNPSGARPVAPPDVRSPKSRVIAIDQPTPARPCGDDTAMTWRIRYQQAVRSTAMTW